MTKKLKIKSNGDVILPNEIVENNLIINSPICSYLDFQSGNLTDKKLSLQKRNFLVTGRDTVMIDAKCYGLDPYIKNNTAWQTDHKVIDLSDYIDKTKSEYSFRVTTFYKFKARIVPENVKGVKLRAGMYHQKGTSLNQDDFSWYTYADIGTFRGDDPNTSINRNNIYQGVKTGIMRIPTSNCQILPWIQIDTTNADALGVKLDMYDFTIEIQPISGFLTHNLNYKIKSLEIAGFGDPDYDLEKIKIQRYNGTYLNPSDVTFSINGQNYETLLSDNPTKTFRGTGTSILTIHFKRQETIREIYLTHSNKRFYSEQILGVDSNGLKAELYFSYGLAPFSDTKKYFPNYIKNKTISLEMQKAFSPANGVQLTNSTILSNLFRPTNENFMRFKPDFTDIQNKFITYSLPCQNQSFTGSVNSIPGEGTIVASVWIKVSKECDSNMAPRLIIQDGNTVGVNGGVITFAPYKMSKKGEWQFLTCKINNSEMPSSGRVRTILRLSKDVWTKGEIEFKSIQMVYNNNKSELGNKITATPNAYVDILPSIINGKSVFLEVNREYIPMGTNQLLWIGCGTGKGITIMVEKTSGVTIINNGRKIQTSITNNTKGKLNILINKNGDIYINGKKECTVSDFVNVTALQLGTPYDTQFTGQYKRLLTFYNQLSEAEAKNLTSIRPPRIPLEGSEIIEKPKSILKNYKYYYFPLIDDYYDYTHSIELPSYNVENNICSIKNGIGHVCSPNYGKSFFDNKTHYHNGKLNPQEDIILTLTENNITMTGFLDILDPSSVTDDDYIALVLKYDNGDSVTCKYKLKNKKYFKVSDYNFSTRRVALRIVSKADIVLKDLVAKTDGGCLDKQSSMSIPLCIYLQKLINIPDNFTIIFDIENTVRGAGNYMINSLGRWNDENKNYIWFGKGSNSSDFGSGACNMIDVSKYTKPNLTAYDWIGENKFRVFIRHNKAEKQIDIKYINTKIYELYGSSKYKYNQDQLDLLVDARFKKGITLFLGGWGDNVDVNNCYSIISNLHVIQKYMKDDELNKYMSPMSIGKDYVRAGLEFNELNNI